MSKLDVRVAVGLKFLEGQRSFHGRILEYGDLFTFLYIIFLHGGLGERREMKSRRAAKDTTSSVR